MKPFTLSLNPNTGTSEKLFQRALGVLSVARPEAAVVPPSSCCIGPSFPGTWGKSCFLHVLRITFPTWLSNEIYQRKLVPSTLPTAVTPTCSTDEHSHVPALSCACQWHIIHAPSPKPQHNHTAGNPVSSLILKNVIASSRLIQFVPLDWQIVRISTSLAP